VFNHKFTYSTQASTGPVASDLAVTSPYFTRSQAHKFYIYESDEDETTDGPPTATNVGHFSQKKRLSAFIITFGRSQAYGVKSIGGTGMLSRHDWVEVRGAAAGGAVARERRRREAHGRGFGALPQKILKN